MARRARIHYPGAIYHVTLRGNGGQNIFFDEPDRLRFYDLFIRGHTHGFLKLNAYEAFRAYLSSGPDR